MAKSADDRVSLRGGTFYYVRRVPKKFAEVDGRVIVRISLHTSDPDAARKAAAVAEAGLEALWTALATQGSSEAWARYKATMQRAQLEGFAYRSVTEIAHGRLEEILDRMEGLAGRAHDFPTAAAIGGAAPRPEITLTGALTLYFDFVAHELVGKREDQIRRWKNPRELAINNFKEHLGEDRRIDRLTREDARSFRQYWVDRIKTERLGRNAANKQFGHLRRILYVVNEELKLGLDPIFSGINLNEIKTTRPPFSREWVEGTLLRPGALDRMNLEARVALLVTAETGMGPEEITSLEPEHIHLKAPIPYVSVVAREGAEQKTEYRPREIPLVGVALLALKALPNGMSRYKGKPASLSAAINKYLNENKLLQSDRHSLYSLRHSFQDRLTRAEAPDRLQADLMGHKYVRERYGIGAELDQKQRWLRKLAYKVPAGFKV